MQKTLANARLGSAASASGGHGDLSQIVRVETWGFPCGEVTARADGVALNVVEPLREFARRKGPLLNTAAPGAHASEVARTRSTQFILTVLTLHRLACRWLKLGYFFA
jgi:hypothetical protein